jgi:hypothetical protein
VPALARLEGSGAWALRYAALTRPMAVPTASFEILSIECVYLERVNALREPLIPFETF